MFNVFNFVLSNFSTIETIKKTTTYCIKTDSNPKERFFIGEVGQLLGSVKSEHVNSSTLSCVIILIIIFKAFDTLLFTKIK